MNISVTPAPLRSEAIQRSVRSESLRLIDYSPFPRMDLDRGTCKGMSLNESETGLCIALEDEVEVGSMLRVVIRGVDGEPTRDIVTRVVWCRENIHGRVRAGLAFLREGRARMLKVRRTEHRTQTVITA